jgi:hypothetical protein
MISAAGHRRNADQRCIQHTAMEQRTPALQWQPGRSPGQWRRQQMVVERIAANPQADGQRVGKTLLATQNRRRCRGVDNRSQPLGLGGLLTACSLLLAGGSPELTATENVPLTTGTGGR